jgi:hypothetical protein
VTRAFDSGRAFVTDCARDLGFDVIADALGRLARPSLRLEATDAPSTRPALRLGGNPDLPPDAAWPVAGDVWPVVGDARRPLTFIGQLDAGELDVSVWNTPREGLLSFFGLQDSSTRLVVAGHVLHTPPSVPLVPTAPPEDLPTAWRLRTLPVVARPELTLPRIAVWPSAALAALGFGDGGPFWPGDGEEAYKELVSRLAEHQGFPGEHTSDVPIPEHRVLGWPRHVQNDILEELAHEHLLSIGQRPAAEEDIAAVAREWRLLLQVEADYRLADGELYGQGLYFGLPAEDLAAGRFDRVEALSQY